MEILNSFVSQFKGWNKFEKFLGILAILGSIGLTILWGDNLFGLSVTLTGILCVILVAKGNIWNYFWGTYNVIGYAYIAHTWGLNGEVMLNALYFLPMQLIGFMMWRKHTSDSQVKMKDLSVANYIVMLLVSAILVIFYADILVWLGDNVSFLNTQELAGLDSMSTVLSVIAMILMAKRYAAQWLLWIIVDVVSVAMWVGAFADGSTEAPAMILMWTIYLINAVYGYYVWLKASK